MEFWVFFCNFYLESIRGSNVLEIEGRMLFVYYFLVIGIFFILVGR